MIDSYLSIQKHAEGLYKEKGSKFISYAYPVTSEEEIKKILATLKKEHHAARHWCYAYRLGADKKLFRANDDGEPSGTAGKPILNQLISADLSCKSSA
ncbi:MAG TPA: YigZ family protein [Bacteroidia bacterium]|jgi:putative IMPACT (imprinted ancient) family translation regulator|nr:YigZ family protein [Bacteroidia bacterium]